MTIPVAPVLAARPMLVGQGVQPLAGATAWDRRTGLLKRAAAVSNLPYSWFRRVFIDTLHPDLRHLVIRYNMCSLKVYYAYLHAD